MKTINSLSNITGNWKGIPWTLQQHCLIFNPSGTSVQYSPEKEDCMIIDGTKSINTKSNQYLWTDLEEFIESVIFNTGIDLSACPKLDYLLSDLYHLTYLDTTGLKSAFTHGTPCSINGFLAGCSHLEEADLSFLPPIQTDTFLMYELFKDCSSLKSIQLFPLTVHTASCNNMFSNCVSLSSIDLSGITFTGPHPEMRTYSMCRYCSNLKSFIPPHSSRHLIELVDTDNMFYDCRSLETLNLSSFVCKEPSFTHIFTRCTQLRYIQLFTIDTSKNPITIRDLFQECFNMKQIDFSKTKLDYPLTINFDELLLGHPFLETLILPECKNKKQLHLKGIHCLLHFCAHGTTTNLPVSIPPKTILTSTVPDSLILDYLHRKYFQPSRRKSLISALAENFHHKTVQRILPQLLQQQFLSKRDVIDLIGFLNQYKTTIDPVFRAELIHYTQ